MPAWGSLDILEACGASDSGSNPDAGISIVFVKFSTFRLDYFMKFYFSRRKQKFHIYVPTIIIGESLYGRFQRDKEVSDNIKFNKNRY